MQYTIFHYYNWESWTTYPSYTKAALAPWNHGGSGQHRGSSNPRDLLSSDFATIVTVLNRLYAKFRCDMINSNNRHPSQATTWQRTKGISKSIEAWAPKTVVPQAAIHQLRVRHSGDLSVSCILKGNKMFFTLTFIYLSKTLQKYWHCWSVRRYMLILCLYLK